MTAPKMKLSEQRDDWSQYWPVDDVIRGLRVQRDRWRAVYQPNKVSFEYPSRIILAEIAVNFCNILFPRRMGAVCIRQFEEDEYIGSLLFSTLGELAVQVNFELALKLSETGDIDAAPFNNAKYLVQDFALALPDIRAILDEDIEAAYRGDPAANSVDEILLAYPGVLALIYHRLAHLLHVRGVPIVARMISETAHSLTGIDIHPGAEIGAGFFIDHGTGVVIGETAVIGKNVRIYQAVTLGAKRFDRDEQGVLKKGQPRHPIIEDDVVIYAGATILGRITIGKGSSIGGNVWLTRSVPASSNVTQSGIKFEAQFQDGEGI